MHIIFNIIIFIINASSGVCIHFTIIYYIIGIIAPKWLLYFTHPLNKGYLGGTYLLNRVLALEQYPPSDEFGKYTTDAPHVYGRCVVFGTHQYFWRPIILCHHFLSHVFGLIWFFYSGQTKVTNLQTREM